MKQILINASNLHVGGGVQVATSIIGELTQISPLPERLVVWASEEVDSNLRSVGYDLTAFHAYEVVNSYGLRLLVSPLHRRLQQFDAVFTIFGPLYVWRLAGKNIIGFAQAWIVYPNNEIEFTLGLFRRWKTRLKFKLQTYFFKRADNLVVELEHVRTGLINLGIGNQAAIHVVRNSLSSLYSTPSVWQNIKVPSNRCGIKLGFVGRNYAHKNTAIFPELTQLLRCNHNIIATIYVTFTDKEWAACSDAFRQAVVNVGPLLVTQCPSFYKQMDGVIFPSLLECFSATPLEAMAMRKPLFVSDRPFNRDVCHQHAYYFDPLSPASAAEAIAKVMLTREHSPEALRAAREHAMNFSNPRQRAEQCLTLLSI